MRARGHIKIFLTASLVWVGFWIAGLPSYYQQYSPTFMIWFDALLFLPIGAVVWVVLRRVRARRRMKVALWMAFYFTVPLAIYDWLYCGVYLDHGLSSLWRFWYLTVYYAIPWLLLPAVAATLNQIGRRNHEA